MTQAILERESTGTDLTLLMSLLEEQRVLFARLRVLADRQKALVVQEDPQPLLTLLAERQLLVDGLVAVNNRLAPYRSRWTSIYSGLDEPSRRHVAELLEESNAALSSILQSDSRDTAMLEARRQDMVGRLGACDHGVAAASAYAAASMHARGPLTDEQA